MRKKKKKKKKKKKMISKLTCRPTRYVNVLPVTGTPSSRVRVTRGMSHRYGTNSEKMTPYLIAIVKKRKEKLTG